MRLKFNEEIKALKKKSKQMDQEMKNSISLIKKAQWKSSLAECITQKTECEGLNTE